MGYSVAQSTYFLFKFTFHKLVLVAAFSTVIKQAVISIGSISAQLGHRLNSNSEILLKNNSTLFGRCSAMVLHLIGDFFNKMSFLLHSFVGNVTALSI